MNNIDQARNQKIIVALFLLLGKAYRQLSPKKRDHLMVTEGEIRNAWMLKKSPVRLVSQMSNVFEMERTFKVVLGDLDLSKTGMDMSKSMPAEPVMHTNEHLKRPTRIFDLE